MALDQNGGTTHGIDCGSDASIDDFTEFTAIMLFKLDSTATARRLWDKSGEKASLFSPSGWVRSQVNRATTSAETDGDTVFSMDTWYWGAWTYDETNGIDQYVATLGNLLAIDTYSAQEVGAGPTDADASGIFCWGRSSTSSTQSLDGQIATGQYYNRSLSLEEMHIIQHLTQPLEGCRIWTEAGLYNGTGTQQDLSGYGNTGTFTGNGVVAHPPVVRRFNRDLSGPKGVASGIARGKVGRTLANTTPLLGGLAG